MDQLTDRQRKILELIIREYVKSAQPISSKSLEESGDFSLSSATLRSEMQELERLGYLEQPHTSAGRVPSDKAYRLFVDTIIKQEHATPAERVRRHISTTLRQAGDDPRDINRATAQMLSGLCNSLVITGIDEDDDFFKFGLSTLFNMPEFREFQRARQIADMFDQFDEMFGVIARSLFAVDLPSGEAGLPAGRQGQVRIFIGRESPFRRIQDEAVIVGRYQLPHQFRGSLTVIGPTRMNYERNLNLIQYTVEELNRIANQM